MQKEEKPLKPKPMIAFNIIGRNEGERLRRCLQSILNVIDINKINNYEIIYVDSNSTDDSIEIAKSFSGVKVFQVTGKANAAVGRNIAGKECSADVLFFIDGDMELQPELYNQLINENGKMRYPFMSGQFENIYYDNNGNIIGNELYHKTVLDSDKYQITTGGLFVIEKKYWKQLNGMRTRFKTGEDLDLGLRMAKKGKLLLRKKELWAKHHTIHYFSFKRMWIDLFKGNSLYARSVLYRHHILNKYIIKKVIKSDPTAILLAFTTIFALISGLYYAFLGYLAIVMLVLLISKLTNSILLFFNRTIFQIIRDVVTILGFLFFYPRDIKPNYIKLN